MIASNDSQTLKVITLHKTNLSNKNAITENLECSNTDLYRRVWKILKFCLHLSISEWNSIESTESIEFVENYF